MSLNVCAIMKLFVVPLLVVLTVIFVTLAATRRDSRYYHWLSRVISPVSQVLLPAYKADPQPEVIVENFDDANMERAWKWHRPELVAISYSNKGVVIASKAESVWYQNRHGPMLYRYFEGDGSVSVTVKTRKTSDGANFPDTQWQFGGLIFRNPASAAWFAKENYVFNVVGYRHSALQVEIKSTSEGYSDVSAFDWPTGDAELGIRRRGAVFTLKARPIGSDDWQTIGEYSRPDLPSLLQVGIIVYSYSEGRGIYDLSVEFDNLEIRSL